MPGRFRRDREWRSERREFIYLDEVSVTSLIAARDGAIAETVTETLSRSAEADYRISANVPIKGAKVGIASGQRVTDTSSREVVRRAVIQSTFRNLRTGGRQDSLPLVRDSRDTRDRFAAKFARPEDLTRRKQRKLTNAGLLTALDTLRRGDVIEIEVRLRPHKLFTLVSAIDSFADLMKGLDQLFGAAAKQVAEVAPIADVIERLMVGLVPVQGTAANVAIIDIDGLPHLIDTRVIKPGSELAGTTRPFELVAVTEGGSYWKDLRRVLYTENEYTVYARVVSPNLQTAWNPVKLADLMSHVNQDLAAPFKELPNAFDGAFGQDEPEPALDIRGMFHRFADAIAVKTGTTPDETSIADAVTAAHGAFIAASADVVLERAAFDIVTHEFEKTSGQPIDRELVCTARTTVAVEALPKAVASVDTLNAPAQALPIEQLEVEVVAIHW
jgi:hypothetical protein